MPLKLLVPFLLLFKLSNTFSRPWLLEGLQNSDTSSSCDDLMGLSNHQRVLCMRHRETRLKLSVAAVMAHQECMSQFQYNPWNCSREAILQLNSMTRETGYVTAIGSAAIVHSIARACADGAIRACGCGVNTEYSAACDDNIKYGITFARQLLDTPVRGPRPELREREDMVRAAVNVHNNNAGRQIIDLTAKLKCQCYGLSGSCTTYTCYKQVPSFTEVGRELYRRYKEAVRIRREFSPSTSTRLAFIDESPNYCKRNETLGIVGTKDRLCLPKGTVDSCDDMCCGQGYTTIRNEKVVPCQCTFEWCCEVTCKNCTEVYYTHTCNG